MGESLGQQDRYAILPANVGIHGNGYSIRPGPLWGI